MERDLDNDEFELFLKQKADQYKLYPSDKSWKGIYHALHPGMKWFKIGGSLLIFSTLFIFYQETSFFRSATPSLKKNNPAVPTLLLNPVEREGVTPLSATLQTNTVNKQPVPAEKLVTGVDDKITREVGVISNPSNKPVSSVLATGAGPSSSKLSVSDNVLHGFLLQNDNVLKLQKPVDVTIPANQVAVVAEQHEQSDITPGYDILKPMSSTAIGNALSLEKEVAVKELNWRQEMAVIKLAAHKKSKFNLQFYFSPTVGYRRLADNQNISHSSILNTPAVSRDLNINRYVDHNPAIGAELGSNILFAATRNFTLKSGVQLNYSRYNIKAFKFVSEKASIALNTAGRVTDTISSYTTLRNFSGYAPEELQNQYLQVSVPVGAELKLLGNKRLQFSIAGTIQPTFLLFSDTYLLSTNYLNYTKEPSLIRKWNVHSSAEAFLSYKIGGLRWQLGPQFRYQLMSSFNDRYPIKEYLFEYGVKFGISKTLR